VPRSTIHRGTAAIVAERVRRFIKRHRILVGQVERLVRIAEASPAPVAWAVDPLTRRMRRKATLPVVILVMDAFETQGVPSWLAGGWGVDALLGRQTRQHKDLDVVIGDFERNEPEARRVLLSLGFRHVKRDTAGAWMPSRSIFEDDAGCCVELLDVDWEYLRGVLAFDPELRPKSTSPSEELTEEVFTVGSLDGRALPCLSAVVQLLFHAGFPLEAPGRVDVSLLRSQLGLVKEITNM
jgi:lincosamide nucleotidyltransferase A/C/D/E